MFKYIRLITILICTAVLLTACQLTPKPEETLYRYEAAINDYDIDAAIKCFEPSVQKVYKGGMELGSSLLGMDLDTMIGVAGGFADLFGDELVEGEMPKMKLTINSKKVISNKEVLFNVSCSYDNLSGIYGDVQEDSISEDMDVLLVLIDNKWYISADSEMPGMEF